MRGANLIEPPVTCWRLRDIRGTSNMTVSALPALVAERCMRLYRFRIVNPPSELVEQREHECSSDAAAATRARTLCNGHNVEVWQGSRWVATIKEYSTNSGAPLSRVVP